MTRVQHSAALEFPLRPIKRSKRGVEMCRMLPTLSQPPRCQGSVAWTGSLRSKRCGAAWSSRSFTMPPSSRDASFIIIPIPMGILCNISRLSIHIIVELIMLWISDSCATFPFFGWVDSIQESTRISINQWFFRIFWWSMLMIVDSYSSIASIASIEKCGEIFDSTALLQQLDCLSDTGLFPGLSGTRFLKDTPWYSCTFLGPRIAAELFMKRIWLHIWISEKAMNEGYGFLLIHSWEWSIPQIHCSSIMFRIVDPDEKRGMLLHLHTKYQEIFHSLSNRGAILYPENSPKLRIPYKFDNWHSMLFMISPSQPCILIISQ